jgi:tol-pal system protein YbgF
MKRRGRMLWMTLAALAAALPVFAAGLPDQAEVALWDRARSGDRVALRTYLERYPFGYWAEQARQLQAQTTGQTSPPGVFLTPTPPPPAVSATPLPPSVSTAPLPPQPTAPALPPPPPVPESGSTAATPQSDGGLRSGGPTELYNKAFGSLRQGKWAEAEAALSELLRRWPQDELAPNARYWLAETYFQRGDNARAAQTFAEVYRRTPNAPRAPDALFKEGLSREQAGDHYGACSTWMRLKRDYPDATARYALDDRC